MYFLSIITDIQLKTYNLTRLEQKFRPESKHQIGNIF